jgi:hypothetical protein
MRNTEEPKRWLDLFRLRSEEAKSNELEAEAKRLHAPGHFVTLSAGENCLIDELFLFRDAVEATEFYERGFAAWEKFLEGEAEGFARLYEFGRLVASKSCPPSIRLEVNHEQLG